MESGREQALAQWAGAQWSLVTYAQCRDLGISRNYIRRRLQVGLWQPLYRNIFKTSSAPVSLEQREMGALLAAGKDSVLSHHNAARHLRLDVRGTSQINVSVPFERRLAPLSGVRFWRTRQLELRDWKSVGSLRVTNLARTILDLASVLNERWLGVAVDAALRQNRSHLNWIHRVFTEQGKGRRGAGTLKKILLQHEPGAAIPDNPLESIGQQLAAQMPIKPVLRYIVCDDRGFVGEVDLAWPEAKLCVELDGFKTHSSRTAFQRDRERDRQLVRMGWQSLRYTWDDVNKRPAAVAQELIDILASRLTSLKQEADSKWPQQSRTTATLSPSTAQ